MQSQAGNKADELLPNLNTYVRTKLPKGEVLNFADCVRVLAAAQSGQDASGQELAAKVLPRLALFGQLPPALIPHLTALRQQPDGKPQDRKLLRLVNYLLQVAISAGSGGTTLPFSPLSGQLPPLAAIDQLQPDVLKDAYADANNDGCPHYQRSACLRVLAALTRASLVARPGDPTMLTALMASTATLLDKVENARRRKLPFFGTKKKSRDLDRKMTLERVAVQRAALSAARVGLPRQVLSSKIGVRAFQGVNSPDPVTARHALAIAALLARDAPASYIEKMTSFLNMNLDLFHASGSLTGVADAPAAGTSTAPASATHIEGALNLMDQYSRVYLARGCAAIIYSGMARGNTAGSAAPFWHALCAMACTDASNVVALEAIRAIAGAPLPEAARVKPSEDAKQRLKEAVDEREEVEHGRAHAYAWQVLLAHADDDAPGHLPLLPQQQPRQASAFTLRRGATEDAALKRLAAVAAASGGDGAGGKSIIGRITERLLGMLGQMSHASVCAACRAVAALAQGRARTYADMRREEALGSEHVQQCIARLEAAMLVVANDQDFSAHERELALEALLWLMLLPHKPPTLAPHKLVDMISTGGGSVSPAIRANFADPWPEDVLASFLAALLRRLLAAPDASEYLLACTGAVVSACPSRVRQEQLQLIWDVALKYNPSTKLAAVKAALGLLSAPLPAISLPPAISSPEVKALASKEETAMHGLCRSVAWWLGENANMATSVWAWKPVRPAAVTDILNDDQGSPQDKLATVAVATNPVLAMVMSHLQRAMVTGQWEMRATAAQAVAKIAVRSPEPFRIHGYSMLTAAVASQVNGHVSRDALGLCANLKPIVAIFNAVYAGELVVAKLCKQFGMQTAAWPEGLLDSLRQRHAALQQQVAEKVCGVPRDVFFPLGPKSRQLFADADAEEAAKEEKPEEESVETDELSSGAATPRSANWQEALKGFEYKAPLDEATSESTAIEDGSVTHEDESAEPDDVDDSHSTDSSVVEARPGQVMYDFTPETDEEIPVRHGDRVLVDYQVGDWLYVIVAASAAGPERRGLVPKAYVQIDEAEADASWAAATSTAYHQAGEGVGDAQSVEVSSYSLRAYSRRNTADNSRAGEPSTAGHARTGSMVSQVSHRRSISGVSDGNTPVFAHYFGAESGQEDEEDEAALDPYVVQTMKENVMDVAREIEPLAKQVDEMDSALRAGALFNQPQYLALKEMLTRQIMTLGGTAAVGEARLLKQQKAQEANQTFDKLEGVRRYAMGGAFSPGGSTPSSARLGPFASYRQQQQQQDAAAREVLSAGSRHTRNPSFSQVPLANATSLQSQPSMQSIPASPGAAASDLADIRLHPGRVLYEFAAEAEGELSVAAGEVLLVEDEVDGWYQVVRESDGHRGLVPASYMELVEG